MVALVFVLCPTRSATVSAFAEEAANFVRERDKEPAIGLAAAVYRLEGEVYQKLLEHNKARARLCRHVNARMCTIL